MMGLTGLSTLTHRLEDLFVVFREDPSRLSGYEQETFDLIFEATDFIREELKRMKFESFEPVSYTHLCFWTLRCPEDQDWKC